MTLRILHVVASLEVASGGPARSVPELCVAEASLGASVSLIAMMPAGGPQFPGVRVRSVSPLRGTRQGLTRAFGAAIREELGATDLVHLHGLWNLPITVAAANARRSGHPYVISPRGMLQAVSVARRHTRKRVAYALWENRTINSARGIHLLTELEEHDSQKLLPAGALKAVIPNGIDPSVGEATEPGAFQARFPQLENRKLILFLGRLHWSKNLELQLEAFARLPRDGSFVWVLVGPDEGAWDGLARSIKQRRLEKDVVWIGQQSHEVSLEALRDADMMLMTSHHEGHSMAMNEALALGVPLIITGSVGFPRVGEVGAGIVVDPDPDTIASEVTRLLGTPSALSSMKGAAVNLVRDELAWPRVAARMNAFYEDVMGSTISGR